MRRTDFSFDLPPALIAQQPRERGRSRLMIVGGADAIEHSTFDHFPDQLSAGDVLVLNDTRVIPARLFAEPKGEMKRRIEILLTRQKDALTWEAWAKPAKRLRPGDVLQFSDALQGEILGREEGTVVIRFRGDLEEIERVGAPPLPPYIARSAGPDDRDAYQTVYAAKRGAIAAPTAGLHFTPQILDSIARRGVEVVRITLHVGIGTFKPVKADDIRDHRMDPERYEISDGAASALNRAMEERRRIVAVGTTSVRTLESAVRAGDGHITAGAAETSIFITPGFEFRVVDRLLTNFHLPESTLLMLVSAFAGVETIRAAYRAAIEQKYFFYSYGDAMLLKKC